jgi:hypothetical protein
VNKKQPSKLTKDREKGEERHPKPWTGHPAQYTPLYRSSEQPSLIQTVCTSLGHTNCPTPLSPSSYLAYTFLGTPLLDIRSHIPMTATPTSTTSTRSTQALKSSSLDPLRLGHLDILMLAAPMATSVTLPKTRVVPRRELR